jgi:hypothetical protein
MSEPAGSPAPPTSPFDPSGAPIKIAAAGVAILGVYGKLSTPGLTILAAGGRPLVASYYGAAFLSSAAIGYYGTGLILNAIDPTVGSVDEVKDDQPQVVLVKVDSLEIYTSEGTIFGTYSSDGSSVEVGPIQMSQYIPVPDDPLDGGSPSGGAPGSSELGTGSSDGPAGPGQTSAGGHAVPPPTGIRAPDGPAAPGETSSGGHAVPRPIGVGAPDGPASPGETSGGGHAVPSPVGVGTPDGPADPGQTGAGGGGGGGGVGGLPVGGHGEDGGMKAE